MNIQLNISLNSGLMDLGGNPVSIAGSICEDMFLTPFYATEHDVLSAIMDGPSSAYTKRVREIIFNSSLKAQETLSDATLKEWGITGPEAFKLRRQYTICMSVYEFSKGFYRDYLSAVKKSKFLGDVKVSLDISKDPTFIMQMSNDAKECFTGIASCINGGTGMKSFVLGRSNACNTTSHRQWFPAFDRGHPRVPIAANHFLTFGSKYKIGVA